MTDKKKDKAVEINKPTNSVSVIVKCSDFIKNPQDLTINSYYASHPSSVSVFHVYYLYKGSKSFYFQLDEEYEAGKNPFYRLMCHKIKKSEGGSIRGFIDLKPEPSEWLSVEDAENYHQRAQLFIQFLQTLHQRRAELLFEIRKKIDSELIGKNGQPLSEHKAKKEFFNNVVKDFIWFPKQKNEHTNEMVVHTNRPHMTFYVENRSRFPKYNTSFYTPIDRKGNTNEILLDKLYNEDFDVSTEIKSFLLWPLFNLVEFVKPGSDKPEILPQLKLYEGYVWPLSSSNEVKKRILVVKPSTVTEDEELSQENEENEEDDGKE
jgi:hypothetical protein